MGKIYTAGSAGGTTSSDVTASRADILQDKYTVTTDSDDEVVGGTMPNRGAWTSGTSGNGRVGIPAGYHNGGGYVDGAGAYNSGVSAADNRENTNSVSYKNGYSKGVWDADARANPSSNNYQSGYNAGYAAKQLRRVYVGAISCESEGRADGTVTIGCTGVPGWQNLTADNFAIENLRVMVSYRYDYGDGNLPGVDATATKSYGGGVLTVNLPYSYEKRVWYEGQANEGWRYRYIRSRADVYAYYSS